MGPAIGSNGTRDTGAGALPATAMTPKGANHERRDREAGAESSQGQRPGNRTFRDGHHGRPCGCVSYWVVPKLLDELRQGTRVMTSKTKSAATSSAIKHLNEDRNPRGKDDKRNASSGGNHPITMWCLLDKMSDVFFFMP
jgi:hypothetical protein